MQQIKRNATRATHNIFCNAKNTQSVTQLAKRIVQKTFAQRHKRNELGVTQQANFTNRKRTSTNNPATRNASNALSVTQHAKHIKQRVLRKRQLRNAPRETN